MIELRKVKLGDFSQAFISLFTNHTMFHAYNVNGLDFPFSWMGVNEVFGNIT